MTVLPKSLPICGRKTYCNVLLLSIALFSASTGIFAQQNIRNNWQRFAKSGTTSSFLPGEKYYLAEHAPNWKDVSIVRTIDAQHSIVTLNNAANYNRLRGQTKLYRTNNDWKFSPQAEKNMATAMGRKAIVITVNDSAAFVQQYAKRNIEIHRFDQSSSSFVITANTNEISTLVNDDNVVFIDQGHTAHEEVNIIGYDRSFQGINRVDYLLPNTDGHGIIAGVKENSMDSNDVDLIKRVITSPLADADKTYHATVIASIIGGAGNSFYSGRGIAHHARFFPSSFDNLFADNDSILRANKVSVQNHSYGTIIQQFYGAEAVSYDALTWKNKNIIPVFSAGNQGTAAATEGPYANMAGYANLTGNFKMAKNVITVGAITPKNMLAPESSSGPLYDGRVAPQLTALGPNGTSEAAAMISGCIAVIQQVYADSNLGALPEASLVKALLYNNTTDIGYRNVDYKTGYGLANAYESILALQRKHYDSGRVKNGETWSRNIAVPANAAQVKITLCWTDTTASVNTNKALINDLDITLTDVNTGIVYQPWVLNNAPSIDSITMDAVRGRDSLNTAEQVSIDLPTAGNYTVSVKGYDISNASLSFHVSWRIDTLNHFEFTNPISTSDINPQKESTLAIKWNTTPANINERGDLFISYNSGESWQLLSSNYLLANYQYDWPIKDTSSTALLRMQTSFGNFYSREFIISNVIRPILDYNCTDSLRLSWDAHAYAKSYDVFALADSPYLKKIATTNNTYIILNKQQYPFTFYAVQPVLNNGLEAAKSVGFDINLQSVYCFYKTIYYNLLADNKVDIILELSETNFSDSIYFEQVDMNGNLLTPLLSQKVIAGQLVYTLNMPTQDAGNFYVRARIKLKSGAYVKTIIISIITTGKKYIYFYPNPVTKNSPINFISSGNTPGDSKLQLIDATGRMVRNYSSLPLQLETYGLATGLYFYRLVSPEKKVLQTGKLLIQ